jgi:hypothetical protein
MHPNALIQISMSSLDYYLSDGTGVMSVGFM